MNKVINISSNGIKQAIDDLVNENEMLQDKVYKLENIIKEVREYIEKHKVMIQGHFDGKQWIYQYYELICEPKELLEILDKDGVEK